MFKRVGVLLLKDRLVLFMSEIQKWFILPSSHVTAYGQALCELTLCGIECNSTKYTNVWDSESSFIVLDYQLVFQFHLLLSAFPSNCIGTDLFSNLCLEWALFFPLCTPYWHCFSCSHCFIEYISTQAFYDSNYPPPNPPVYKWY